MPNLELTDDELDAVFALVDTSANGWDYKKPLLKKLREVYRQSNRKPRFPTNYSGWEEPSEEE